MTFEHYSCPAVEGSFVDLDGERYYKISHVDQMNPFFISVVSASDHWLFISSTGSLSAGRIRPENALFPYKSVDHIHENAENTGSKTIIKVAREQGMAMWEPFNRHHDGLYQVERHLYKNTIGDKIVFEELNHTLKLKFQYSWNTSEEFGFVRRSQITDLSGTTREIELIDGLQNLLPSGAPLSALQTRSALVDAYKWNELLDGSSLALFTMYAKLSDRAEPAESLLATTVFSVDNDYGQRLLSSSQVSAFRQGREIKNETLTKGVRGSYLIHKSIKLEANQSKSWLIIADIDKNHSDVTAMRNRLAQPVNMTQQVEQSIAANQQELISLMSGADAWQITAEEETSVHHYANVLFNNMRGGVFENNYTLDKKDVLATIRNANRLVFERHAGLFADLPEQFTHAELVSLAKQSEDAQLIRLSYEYLPLTFGRRHGDPSRPWNHYEIKLKDDNGERLLSYQGNWRDIFQNWEAIALSYPGFIQSFLAKFVNASTMDGYNPYRITKDGIDWEMLEPDDPWSNIGYWGDHQIIYLLKFLELANKYQRDDLLAMMQSDVFSYANVPYELCDVDKLFANPKDTVTFNDDLQHSIEQRVDAIGSDGRLVLGSNNDVYMVNLTEKVLVPLLAKLSNLVLDGGIWLNTQRPEWNDANNAIVGNGLSMVTLYYMRRYVAFLQQLLAEAPASVSMSKEVFEWLLSTTRILSEAAKEIRQETVTRQTRKAILTQLEKAAEDFRRRVYRVNGFSGKTTVEASVIQQLLDVSLTVLDASIASNLREDGLFNAYNILTYSSESLQVEELYPMLEGQVAVLSAGVLTPAQAVTLLDNLFASEMYREDQNSFMLYPDRDLSAFMNKNSLTAAQVNAAPVLSTMLSKGDQRLVNVDEQGQFHFHASLENSGYLKAQIQQLRVEYADVSEEAWEAVEALYEDVFNHKAFTGRSGTMFGYEGLGCIYWHMVSKLLLAVQENYLAARELDADSEETQKLAEYYYRVRAGIGFNKTPEKYGAFPTDPYSHTPKHAGAQQPGMTGQVKEEIITRFTELGILVEEGEIHIDPRLLHRHEFLTESASFSCQNVAGQTQSYVIEKDQLAFTLCQVPFVYQLVASDIQAGVTLTKSNGKHRVVEGLMLSKELSNHIFARSGEIEKVVVSIPASLLRV
ncbi:TPA: hypothetical protein KD853_004121 [Vibrio parahaemolyticus]|uniref:hypothetical protein n=1 Tax=Vibrio TaxID=662 RepID=UPI001372482A|nr:MULTISPECIES: hypothetical protein [Vibrio]ELB2201666.1 hypothetical protein [Vibrio parahaemolyticus]MCS0322464.1 hypothetical protein [Vibrio diabolicus]NAW83964.1 hypothetical protein [Vibrio sp. V43_P6S15P86]HBC3930958.1 hypothetical protein [Vibrio parahaemolyticus]